MRQRRAFTLIEVLVAITIVGIVSSIAIGQYGSTVGRARYDAARNILLSIYAGEQTYKALNNQYHPSNMNNAQTSGMTNTWREIYVDNPNVPSTGSVDFMVNVTTVGTTFVAKATLLGATSNNVQNLSQDRLFGGNWNRP